MLELGLAGGVETGDCVFGAGEGLDDFDARDHFVEDHHHVPAFALLVVGGLADFLAEVEGWYDAAGQQNQSPQSEPPVEVEKNDEARDHGGGLGDQLRVDDGEDALRLARLKDDALEHIAGPLLIEKVERLGGDAFHQFGPDVDQHLLTGPFAAVVV